MADKEEKALNFTSRFSDFEIVNQEFTKCKCYMLATGDNVNGSDITQEAVDKALERHEFDNKPVVAHLYQGDDGSWRVGGHDSEWIITNTSIDIVDQCIPFGVIPESNDIHLEEVLEPDGMTTNTYLVCDILLWTGRYNIMDAAYNDDIYFNQSCELSVLDYHIKDNDIMAIDDFIFSALCLLNKSDNAEDNVRPCFPSCRVESMSTFSVDGDKFRANFEEMLGKLKEYELDVPSSIQNKTTENSQKGERNMQLSQFAEALSTIKIEGTEDCKYMLINADDNKLYAWDVQDNKPYGFDYVVTTEDDVDSLVVDFDSKEEVSLTATEKITDEDFAGFDMQAIINKKVEEAAHNLEAEYNDKCKEIEDNYAELNKSYEEACKELNDYREAEAAQKKEQHKEEVEELFAKYADKLGKCADFLVYKAQLDVDNTSIEDIDQHLTLMVGKHMMDNQGKKSFSYTPIESGVSDNSENDAKSRYGDLLNNYMK